MTLIGSSSIGFPEFRISTSISVSADGASWRDLEPVDVDQGQDNERTVRLVDVAVGGPAVRFVRVVARNCGPLPSWHAASGEPAWLFIDEIVVESA